MIDRLATKSSSYDVSWNPSHSAQAYRPIAMPKRKSPEGSGAINAERVRLNKQAGVPSQTPYDGPRSVLLDFNSMDKLVATLKACKRVVVVTGAGIRQVALI